MTAFDVPADSLIKTLAKELRERKSDTVQAPVWMSVAKTGVDRELPPEDPDFWYIRAASLLRKLYFRQPVGVLRLRKLYGGRRNRGVRPDRFRPGSGAIIRHLLHQLEKAGLVKTVQGKGRILSPEGHSLLDRLANEIQEQIGGPKKH
jgi:small subunit ribosomal protein S19e